MNLELWQYVVLRKSYVAKNVSDFGCASYVLLRETFLSPHEYDGIICVTLFL